MDKINKTPPLMLVILDGFGYSSKAKGNAVASAKMPFWHWLLQNYPHTLLKASGESVGLLPGYMGNSEVGHLTIGSGRIIESMLKKIHDSIDNGSFFKNQILTQNFEEIKNSGNALHLIGLLSDGGVHSHEYQLYALLKLAKIHGLKKVFVHAFLDGRDVAQKSAAVYLERLEDQIKKIGCGKIASVCGRFYAMDRDKNWDRTRRCYDMLVGNAQNKPLEWQEVIEQAYSTGTTDEFIPPTLLDPVGIIKSGDGVVFFNFRPDRARQLTECFINHCNPKCHANCQTHTTTNCHPELDSGSIITSFFITMTRYGDDFKQFNNEVLFERNEIKNTLLDVLAQQPNHPNVFIIAETEKYAHVTYFFNGMRDHQGPSETRVLIPSIKTETYIAHPEMSANKITEAILKSLSTNPADFYLVNYANADMVGHSGNFDATVKACECLDKQLETLYNVFVETFNGTMIITADHGNAEEKTDPVTGKPLTAHTQNPVPFVIVSNKTMGTQTTTWPSKPEFGVSNIAPTILDLIGIKEPNEMTQEKIEF